MVWKKKIARKKKNPTTSNKTSKGAKFDLGKSRMSLIPFTALRALGDVYTYGAGKYKEHNWLAGMEWSRLQDAMLRHYERFSMGEDIDPETSLLHSAQIAWNAIGLLTYQLLGLGEDDRWKEKANYIPADLVATREKSLKDLDPNKKGHC